VIICGYTWDVKLPRRSTGIALLAVGFFALLPAVPAQAAMPTITIRDRVFPEGALIGVTISLSEPSTQDISFDFASHDGTATSPDDYHGRSGTKTIPAGERLAVIRMTTIAEHRFEPDETLTITLSNPVNATIADGTAVITISNEDSRPQVSVNDVTRVEGTAGPTSMFFTVSLSARSNETITVPYATHTGPATDADYFARSGTMTFDPGELVKALPVWIKGDAVPETTQTFTFDLGTATNATTVDPTGVGTIVDDD
jgi:hypothetical protein